MLLYNTLEKIANIKTSKIKPIKEVANMQKLKLQELAGGALQELFENDLEKVIANLYDKNTSAKKKRRLVMELKMVPTDETREIITVEIDTKTTLAPVEGVTTKIMLDRQGNKLVAAEFGNQMKGQMSLINSNAEECSEGEVIEKNGEKYVSENGKIKPLFKAE